MYITPGFVDSHSHTALDSINEGSVSVTSMVRMRDVVNDTDINIYRQLAGGMTTIHQLHGSANAIGGQNSIIKLKWGRPVEEMYVDDAPRTIKFALGENPKRANFSIPGRTASLSGNADGRRGDDSPGLHPRGESTFSDGRSMRPPAQRGENPLPPRKDLRARSDWLMSCAERSTFTRTATVPMRSPC
jgi:hypothetical protein